MQTATPTPTPTPPAAWVAHLRDGSDHAPTAAARERYRVARAATAWVSPDVASDAGLRAKLVEYFVGGWHAASGWHARLFGTPLDYLRARRDARLDARLDAILDGVVGDLQGAPGAGPGRGGAFSAP